MIYFIFNIGENMNKKIITSSIMSILIVLGCLIYIAYAYSHSSITTNNLNITGAVKSGVVFTLSGSNTSNNFITLNEMYDDRINTVFNLGTFNFVANLTVSGSTPVCCDYDVYWTWTEDSNTTNQYHKTESIENEFGINYYVASASKKSYSDGTVKNYTFNDNTGGNILYNFPDYNASSLSNKLYSSTLCSNQSYETNGNFQATTVSETIAYKILFKNINAEQDAFSGAKFNGKLSAKNITCRKSS